MIRVFKAILIFCSLVMPLPALGWTYYLQADLGVRGH